MRSSKSRSRNKQNRSRTVGNIINRVFDSSGPEGKVRGTPQQIIDKYTQLARDAQLSNDRVAAENFQQHAEHYTRMLGEAMREMEAQRLQNEQFHQNRNGEGRRDFRDPNAEPGDPSPASDEGNDETIEADFLRRPTFAPPEDQPDLGPGAFAFEQADEPVAELVETPEAQSQRPPRPPRKPRERRDTQADETAD